MKIQSRFKDYYDFISHKFGADPNCVYVREPLKEISVEWPKVAESQRFYQKDSEKFFYSTLDERQSQHSSLYMEFVVAGPHCAAYLRRYDSDTMTPLSAVHEHRLMKTGEKGEPLYPNLPSKEQLYDLIKVVGAPVFQIRRREYDGKLLLADRIPILRDLDFPARVPAAQMWQDIYDVLTNVLRHNPDKAPPVTIANDDRIHAAGFDLKTSFRNPINPKPKRSAKP